MKNNDLNSEQFRAILFEKMNSVCPVVETMEFYEFQYCLNTIAPQDDAWETVKVMEKETIQHELDDPDFFKRVAIKAKVDGKIILDPLIVDYTRMLFKGLVSGVYESEWVNRLFYFDPRGFNFLVRSNYLTDEIRVHLGGKPYKQFEQKQKKFDWSYEVGYQEFKDANADVDGCFIECVLKLVKAKGSPIVLAIAGPTAAGKTEIVDRIRAAFEDQGKRIATIELDNYLTDRDQREERGIGSFGKAALHFDLFESDIKAILAGKGISTPRYDFIDGTSSHDLQGKLKPNRKPVDIEAADIIFIEGNSPFLLPEIAPLIGIKVVYLTDDPVRLKRKWRRDIDFRKKYDVNYFRNRFFSEQPPMAAKNYQPQLKTCDLFIDTTGAAVWATPEIAKMCK